MFAGDAARNDIVHYLNDIDNVMNLEHNAHVSYDHLEWGIEAREEDGMVRFH